MHIVEHVEGDNTKFGLRKRTQAHQNDSTIILRTNTEANRVVWVKTLRNLIVDLNMDGSKKHSMGNF